MIPKIFHQVWINDTDPKLPEQFAQYRDGWLRLHPDWEYKLWNLQNLDFPLRRPELIEQAPNYSQLSDLLRFEIIHRYGGIYVDTDFECLRRIEPLLCDVELFFCSEDGETLAAGIFGARPEHDLVLRLIDNLPSKMGSESASIETGPRYVTRTLFNEGFPRDLTLFPRKYFYPYNWMELHRANEAFPEAYAVHRYAASWVKPRTFRQKVMRKLTRMAEAITG
jgi:inositol phosphorylceramide mannosyltransferase catalytic subunit